MSIRAADAASLIGKINSLSRARCMVGHFEVRAAATKHGPYRVALRLSWEIVAPKCQLRVSLSGRL